MPTGCADLSVDVPPGYELVPSCLFCGSNKSEALFQITWNKFSKGRFAHERYRFQLPAIHVRRCVSCGLEYQNPRPTEDLLLTVVSEDYILRFPKKRLLELFRADLGLIREYLPEGSTLVDVGCNVGGFLKLAKDHYGVMGCDPIPKAIEFGRAEYGLPDLHVGTLGQMPPAEVDAVISLDTLEHFHDPKGFLEEAHRRLKPGGLLYIRTIRRDGPNARLSGRHWYGYWIWHTIFPTIRQVKDLCRNCGFEPFKTVVTRCSLSYFLESLKFHAKMALSTIFPARSSQRQFRKRVKQGGLEFSIFRDEFALLSRKIDNAGNSEGSAEVVSASTDTFAPEEC
jgi:2-polyprenyl-3-methyl-5-hydroxy-6-metoxy-1,4-benzoquinol methylase